ncbi:MAG: hypothetical protein A2784_03175 [Candidatus Chisholmbacteria bacterium RIFCSPHIGHO2_01_FULL_48_12]|uniref:Glycosyltransferase RgtA/B/C/D-like domain-containing protein n=1 Tax=Candidatus Chisholmbacteria bacterium RIFCSPHIGHO2_01_FULL_48_12 TaxID=1797589 RepID=A0A1G1VK93_9BACT|nr:MAG: hypothetical protein A2784_03175 [Candidatus Chisholmbacteria bacterium RIFCSPHIGHO2_01_FULL_48_12]
MNKLLIISLVLLTIFTRLYRLPQTFMFAEDQEDLAWRVKQIVIDRKPTLLSAKFSATGLYLPPGYLYFLVPLFMFTNFHPDVGIVAVVLLAGLTALFIFLAGYALGGLKTGFIAWALYTFWPLLHTWDRIFWNPNLILPASSLALLAILKHRPLLAAIASGIAIQSHPQAFMLALLTLVYFRHRWAMILGILFISISPLVLFELRHGFVISHALFQSPSLTFHPYYLLFIYPFVILALTWVFTRHRLLIIFPLLFFITNLPRIFNQPTRPDNLANKLAATNVALDQIQSGQASPNIQIQGSAAGWHYLVWYLSRQRGITNPIAFHESWDQSPPGTVIIKP